MILQGRWAGPMNEELHEELQQEREEVQQELQRRHRGFQEGRFQG